MAVQIRSGRLMQPGVAILVILAFFLTFCQARTSRIVEAEKFVLRDGKGNVRAEIALEGGNPLIRFYDDGGKMRTVVGVGTIELFSEQGSLTMLSDTLQFADEKGLVRARLEAEPGGGKLWLFSSDAKSVTVFSPDRKCRVE
jgi:hypothetical protein